MREGAISEKDYTTTIVVNQTPKEAFDAINNARLWWGGRWAGEIQGATDKVGAEFTYRVPDVHYCKMKVTELVPGKRVVWHVLDSDLSFTKARTEWNDTNISFDISQTGGNTVVRFTHRGLVPAFECYDACSSGWGTLINDSLRSLITAPKEKSAVNGTKKGQNFSSTLLVNATPKQAFDAINNVRGWWSEEIEGPTDKLGGEFTYHYQDVHRCKIKVTDLVPGKKVGWLVMDNYFNFIKDQSEWKGTKINFDISKKGNRTEIRFTHIGLVPEYECFDVCSNAWGDYTSGSLGSLITTGKGHPNKMTR